MPERLPNVIAYWVGKSASYPQLSHMALDVFFRSPRLMRGGEDFQRVILFRPLPGNYANSATRAKRLIHVQRTRLKDIIEASECPLNWQYERLLQWQEEDLQGKHENEAD
jgi:hypothetical protein